MNILNASKNMIVDFAREEDGAQIVEYGLIIAGVSLGLIGLLATLIDTGGGFSTFVSNVGTWLSTGKAPA
jgi:pilus assembly protein Flp/PilA